ncbi:hypothetical protein [Cellulomonas taurus]|uniref:hypothetical protein n=1 Tax=Cellulomonas taurus TaxID=2729175 RepID=UPI00145F3D34|nr:hypothetical protein [Cellulomonas taurus]
MGTSDWIQPPDEIRTRQLGPVAQAIMVASNVGQHETPPPWWVWPVPAPPVEPGAWTVLYGLAESGIGYTSEGTTDRPEWTARQAWGLYAWDTRDRDLTPVDPLVPDGARVEWETDQGTWADDVVNVVVDGATVAGTPATDVRAAVPPSTWAPVWPSLDEIPLSDWITPADLNEWPSDTGTRPERPGPEPGPGVVLSVPYTGDPRVVVSTRAMWEHPPLPLLGTNESVRVREATASFTYTPPRYRIVTVNGAWRLRQRQTLTGTDSWPLRQRQNGGHTGSWSLRQRQRGV